MGSPENQDESERWSALKSGDRSAMDWVVRTFSQVLFNYGMKILPDREVVKDTIQDLFVDIWKNHSKLPATTTSPKFYLIGALRNKIVRIRDKNQKIVSQVKEGDLQLYELPAESVMIAEQTELRNKLAIKDALSKLTDRQREVITLRYFEEMSLEEIANLLNINKQSVYNLVYSALISLKNNLPDELKLMSIIVGCSMV